MTPVLESGALHGAISLGAVLSTTVLVALLWRRRAAPAAEQLLGLATVLCLGAIGNFVLADFGPTRAALVALTGVTEPESWVLLLLFNVVVVAAGFWVAFSFRYTGLGDQAATLAVGIAAAAALSVVGLSVTITVLGPLVPAWATTALVNRVIGAVSFVSFGLLLSGAFLVVRASTNRPASPWGQAASLVAAVFVLPIGVLLSQTGRASPVASATLLATATLFTVAIVRYRPFEALPVTAVVGRDRVVKELTDPVVVVDTESNVRDCNPAAETVFEADAVGRPLTAVTPLGVSAATLVDQPGSEPTVAVDDRVFEVTCRALTDAHDRPAGHLLVFREVTARRQRERRLGVLNEFLVGEVRDGMATVSDAVDPLATRADPADVDPAAIGDEVWQTTTRLADRVTQVRRIERALEGADPTGSSRLVSQLREVLDAAPAARDAVTVTVAVDDDTVAVPEELLRASLELLVEECVTADRDDVGVRVTDDADAVVLDVDLSGSGPDGGAAADERDAPPLPVFRIAVDSAEGTVATVTPDRVTVRLPTPGAAGDDGVGTEPPAVGRERA
ncbi:PAS domain-containing protein [Haloarcula litorea]|uniref:PAS domain-containing protein n=1 Tax=Haloarcula litorea TaxID=3032579 RepID=UPI0023E773F7|nr:PAS domain-containing protein [Halomicroarcula sp. GDY20]